MLRMVLMLGLGVAVHVSHAQEMVHGRVFDDANGNGVLDGGERSIANVAVSNGRDVVRTDRDGRYSLETGRGDAVFVIKPAHWQVPLRSTDGLPGYWHQQPLGEPSGLRFGGLPVGASLQQADFPLQREPAVKGDAAALDVLVFADPQAASRTDVDYYARDIVQPLRDDADAALGITLGDIVNDDLSLYPAMNRLTASLQVPWLHVAGNHDMDPDARDDASSLQTWRRVYGPDTYAWEEPQATFVLLDDVIARPGQKPGYVAGFRDDQLQFLRNYLEGVDPRRLLVIGMHMPMFDDGVPQRIRADDRARLFALLQGFPHVLLLSAHNHTQQHYLHDGRTGWHGRQPLHEYNVGAACGAFWSGLKDAQGIPDSTMADGTPNGFARLHVANGGRYALSWHAARDAAGSALRLHAPNVLRQGAYPAFGVYANVFMGSDGDQVEYRVDGGPWNAMKQVQQADPWLVAQNARDDEAEHLRGYDRSPEAQPGTHLWRGVLPTNLTVGEHLVEVRATPRWGEPATGTLRYRLEQQAQ